MTTTTAVPAGAPTARRAGLLAAARSDTFRLVLWAILAVQALWLGILMARGWYYQDDLAFLAQAHHHGLGSLADPVNVKYLARPDPSAASECPSQPFRPGVATAA